MTKTRTAVLAVVLLSACTGDLPVETDARPSPAISDGVHNGGNPRFLFLPPIVSTTPPTGGPFDAARNPEVRICPFDGTSCSGPAIAVFNAAGGSGGLFVTVDPSEGRYQAKWKTKDFPLQTGDVFRIMVNEGGATLGYVDVTVLDKVTGKIKNNRTDEMVLVDDNFNLHIDFRIETGLFPFAVQVLSGDSQTGTVGTTLGAPVRIRVADASGYPLEGVAVSFEPRAGGGETVSTGADGVASFRWTLGPASGQQLLDVGAVGTGLVVSATATAAGPSGRIVFTSTRDGGDYEIYDMAADGSQVRRLTTSPGYDSQIGLSFDGSKIVFTSRRTGETDLWSMAADGSNLVRLTHWGEYTQTGRWTPDGQRILFNSNTQGDFDLFIMNADGTGIQRLTNTPLSEHAPDWSPDGTKIAFSDNGNGLHTINADGSGLTTLLTGSVWQPRWSPDGTRLLFSGVRDGQQDLYVVDADGLNLTRITHTGGFGASVWSPDGQFIATACRFAGDDEVCVLRSDGTDLRRLTTTPGGDWPEGWAP